MTDCTKKFEGNYAGVFIVLLTELVMLALIDLGWFLLRDVLTPPKTLEG